MLTAWEVASVVAVVAGVVGFFTVLRGSAFAAHAIPNGAFAGAAGASLVGVSTLVGLGAFSLLAAIGIALLGRRGRRDAVTALALVVMLALGALFLSVGEEYAPATYSLLFGEVLGVSANELVPTLALGAACVLAVGVLYRRLLLSSTLADVAAARGVGAFGVELCFLAVLALATTMTVPVVGTLLIFSLMIGPPAAAQALAAQPGARDRALGGAGAGDGVGGGRGLLRQRLPGGLLRGHVQRGLVRGRAPMGLCARARGTDAPAERPRGGVRIVTWLSPGRA